MFSIADVPEESVSTLISSSSSSSTPPRFINSTSPESIKICAPPNTENNKNIQIFLFSYLITV